MIKLTTIIFCILFLFVSISYTADQNSNPCESTSGLGQWKCAQKKMEIADKKLNATYKTLLEKIQNSSWPNGVDPKKDLIEAQRQWIKYRDTNSQFVGDCTGGAPEWRSAYYENCRFEMTEERTKELQKYIERLN
jgi:uncharacterized protein YecT (DUF1311 family)